MKSTYRAMQVISPGLPKLDERSTPTPVTCRYRRSHGRLPASSGSSRGAAFEVNHAVAGLRKFANRRADNRQANLPAAPSFLQDTWPY